MTTPNDSHGQKILIQRVLNVALIGQTVPTQTVGRINGEVDIVQVPVSFIGTLMDGIKVPEESVATVKKLLSDALIQNEILVEGAFSIDIKKLENTKGLPEAKLTVGILNDYQVNPVKAMEYLDRRAEDTTLKPEDRDHARLLCNISRQATGIPR